MNALIKQELAETNYPTDNLLLNSILNTPEDKQWECPCCHRVLPFQSWAWLDELQCLANRQSGTGIHSDINSLTLLEKGGVLLFLRKQGKENGPQS